MSQFKDAISHQAVVFAKDAFFVFGGISGNSSSAVMNDIIRLDARIYSWSKVGVLNTGRQNHNIIFINDFFMVVGGKSSNRYGTDRLSVSTERCQIQNELMICNDQFPILLGYSMWPEVIPVHTGYCTTLP